MGLDIYFYKAKRSKLKLQDNNVEYINSNTFIAAHNLDTDIFNEVAYFRKVNFLLPFFSYIDNCSYREVKRDELERLSVNCTNVLEKRNDETSMTLLPTQSGFFFGNQDYNECYYQDVEDVRNCIIDLLDNWNEHKDAIFLYCWW